MVEKNESSTIGGDAVRETLDTVALSEIDALFQHIPSGPYQADARGEGWEIRQIDTDPTNKHHWPFRLCQSIQGQKAACDDAVFPFIAAVLNVWPTLLAALNLSEAAEVAPVALLYEWTDRDGNTRQGLCFNTPADRVTKVNDQPPRYVGKLYAHPDPEAARLPEELDRVTRERDALKEAITPSGDTKAAYHGEFFEEIEVPNPEYDEDDEDSDDGETILRRVPVQWETVKEIMNAIQLRAARSASSRGGE